MINSTDEEKVVRNGMVAVAISPGFGAGWTSWATGISPFNPKVIKMIEEGKQGEITEEWCQENLGIEHVYCGGASQLTIEWIPQGVHFSINEYDGSESIYRADQLEYLA